MSNLIKCIESKFHQAALESFPDLPFPLEITKSTQPKFGHYQFNSSMKIGKFLAQNPRSIAEKLLSKFSAEDELFEKLEIAGPGFINITLRPEFISNQVDLLLKSDHLNIAPIAQKEKVIIDFSSPNVAKEMHVGHLRSTILGDALSRIFEFLGYDVLRLNHIGDWGTSFGMLIAFMKDNAPDVLSGKETTDLPQLMEWYRSSKKRFDDDPDFKKKSQLEVVRLQGGEKEALKAWKIICEISKKAYQEIYDLLDIKIQERGESFYNPLLPFIVADLENKGLVENSDGAKCIFIEGFQNREGTPLPLMIQKSDGGYNYDTTDMAAIHHRLFEEKGNRLIYITDAGQGTHFEMIFKAAQKANYYDPDQIRVEHVPFGVVLGSDGKKFRTRSGETEKLIDLIYASIEEASSIIAERSPNLDETEKIAIAKALGVGAIKYADLSNHRLSDYTYNQKRMLSFEGNTAAFLLYASVRIEGIKRKIGKTAEDSLNKAHIHLVHPQEIALGLQILQFHETLDAVVDDLLPNRLTDYLYLLACQFNQFFRDCRVEGSPEEKERLLLCEATSRVLNTGLKLLGLQPVEKM